MTFGYNKLKGKIKEVFGTDYEFAKAMGMSRASLSLKLNNKCGWTQEEIVKAVAILGVSAEIEEYFFALEVQNLEQEGVENVDKH